LAQQRRGRRFQLVAGEVQVGHVTRHVHRRAAGPRQRLLGRPDLLPQHHPVPTGRRVVRFGERSPEFWICPRYNAAQVVDERGVHIDAADVETGLRNDVQGFTVAIEVVTATYDRNVDGAATDVHDRHRGTG